MEIMHSKIDLSWRKYSLIMTQLIAVATTGQTNVKSRDILYGQVVYLLMWDKPSINVLSSVLTGLRARPNM